MIQLMQGDCLELMKSIPDKSVDMVLTDPPYMVNHTTGGASTSKLANKWRGNILAGNSIMDFRKDVRFADWMKDIYRIVKDGAHVYVFCNDKNMNELLCASFDVGFRLANILVWVKNNACPNRYYMKNCEFIVFLYKGKAIPINVMGSKTANQYANIPGKQKKHPTQKPIPLLQDIIQNSSKHGETVFDPFMGSGSTGVACVNTGRSFIGMELDAGYFKIASERIETARHNLVSMAMEGV